MFYECVTKIPMLGKKSRSEIINTDGSRKCRRPKQLPETSDDVEILPTSVEEEARVCEGLIAIFPEEEEWMINADKMR